MGRTGNHPERSLYALALSTHVLWRDRKRKKQIAAGFERPRVGLHVAAGDHVLMDWRLSKPVSALHREARERRGASCKANLPDYSRPTGPDGYARAPNNNQRARSG